MSAKPGRSAGCLIGVAATLTGATVGHVLGPTHTQGPQRGHRPRVD